MRPIGIFGGTFDPIHFGHLRPALEVMESLSLAEVRFVPNRVPPHRDVPHAEAEQRLDMLRMALAQQPGFRVDDRELRRDGPSFTVETLLELRRELGAGTPLCLIMGTDAFLGLPGWHRWRELLELSHIVVALRPGTVPDYPGELAALLVNRVVDDAGALREVPAGRVHLAGVTQLEISATGLRGTLAQGGSGRFLIPETVWSYIQRHGLYGSSAP
jgi:nicotinate-nucleotide adenylyltransferase